VKTNPRPDTPPSTTERTIAITGGSGLVGTALRRRLQEGRTTILRLVRRAPVAADEVQWDPQAAFSPDPRLENLDAVVHLAGAGIADRRWSTARREVLLRSRVDGTRFLVEALQQLSRPPAAFVQASAIGWYGDRGDEILTEASPRGRGFLAGLTYAWERAGEPIEQVGTRRVALRMGVVLSTSGGALARMKPLFRLGLGGRLGSGRQWMSWIAMPDLIDIIIRSCGDPLLQGPINAVAPNPVLNRVFTAALARRCHRPAVLPAPAWALKAGLGGMAAACLLSSQRCVPAILMASGQRFSCNTIDSGLEIAS
jgi:hypothetical protein